MGAGSEGRSTPAIVLSSGEPAGIGPDICLGLAREALPLRFGVLADPDLLEQRADELGQRIELAVSDDLAAIGPHRRGRLAVLPVPVAQRVVPGRLDARNAGYVLELLRRGVALCQSGASSALVTAPVQKSIINEAGTAFSGHTEFLAELTASGPPVMLLTGESLRVALATTHLPLREVAASLTSQRLEQTLGVLDRELHRLFGITAPRILVLGLNPHAGEQGQLGDEEQRIIAPALETARGQGLKVIGPVAADTAFNPSSLARCDAVLAMYHDQGLPVLKALEFGRIVNVTLGLTIVRTSVDHGTALELAGTGRADHASLRQALLLAAELATRS